MPRLPDRQRVLYGDCLSILPTLEAESFHAVVCDPPYHLTSIVKGFGAETAAPAQFGKDGAFARASRGFMGKQWDGGDIAFRPETWAEVLRVMKPGAYLVAFASTRGYHRMVCAIEDAGFIIHPLLGWLFGTGFPKATRFQIPELEGWRYGLQALKPALEPICMAQKPMEGTGTQNWLRHGTGGLNIDASRVEGPGVLRSTGAGKRDRTDGYGMQGGVIGGSELGRWPANVLHDGSDEVVGLFPVVKAGFHVGRNRDANSHSGNKIFGARNADTRDVGYADSGSTARFFKSCPYDEGDFSRFHYSAKASAKDRAGSSHPTVKPLALMRWLCTLITPPGGRILDPFAGSGTTLQAALECGFDPLGIENDLKYVSDINRRLTLIRRSNKRPASTAARSKGAASQAEEYVSSP